MTAPVNPGPFYCAPIRVSCLTYPFDLPATLNCQLTYSYSSAYWAIAGETITVMQQVPGPLPLPYHCNNKPCQVSLSTFPAACAGGLLTASVPLTQVALPPGIVPLYRFVAAYVNSSSNYYGGSYAMVWNSGQLVSPFNYCTAWYNPGNLRPYNYPIIDAQGYQSIPSPLAGCVRNTYTGGGCVEKSGSCPLPNAAPNLPPVMSFGSNIGVSLCLIFEEDPSAPGCLVSTFVYFIDLQSFVTTYMEYPILDSSFNFQPAPTGTCLVAPFTPSVPGPSYDLDEAAPNGIAFVGGDTDVGGTVGNTSFSCIPPSPPPAPPPLGACPGPDTTGHPRICTSYQMGSQLGYGIQPGYLYIQVNSPSTDLNPAWMPHFPGQCEPLLPRDLTLTISGNCGALNGSYPLSWAGGDAFDVPVWGWAGIVNGADMVFQFSVSGDAQSPTAALTILSEWIPASSISVNPFTASGGYPNDYLILPSNVYYTIYWTVS